MKKKKKLLIVIFVLCILLIVLCCFIKIHHEYNAAKQTSQNTTTQEKTIVYNGEKYFPKQHQKVLMLAGLGVHGTLQSEERIDGKTPMGIFIIAINEKTETYSIMQLDWQAQGEIITSKQGSDSQKIENSQIADSFIYGKDLRDQCSNLTLTVSEFLTGIEIHDYILIDLDGITTSCDDVGLGYFSHLSDYYSLPRQKDLFTSFLNNLYNNSNNDSSLPRDIYADVDEYVCTDCSSDRMATLFLNVSQYDLDETYTLKVNEETVDGEIIHTIDNKEIMKHCIEFFYERK